MVVQAQAGEVDGAFGGGELDAQSVRGEWGDGEAGGVDDAQR